MNYRGDMLKLKRATFRYIESELYSYKDTLKEIDQLRDEILYGRNNDDENIGGGRSSLPGKPTEQIATRLLTHKTLRNLEEVANAITDVYKLVSDDHILEPFLMVSLPRITNFCYLRYSRPMHMLLRHRFPR